MEAWAIVTLVVVGWILLSVTGGLLAAKFIAAGRKSWAEEQQLMNRDAFEGAKKRDEHDPTKGKA